MSMIVSGNQGVEITRNADGWFRAMHLVDIKYPDPIVVGSNSFKTLAGAQRWALRRLAA